MTNEKFTQQDALNEAKELIKDIENNPEEESEPSSIEQEYVLRIVLSMGGPNQQLKIRLSKEGEVLNAKYCSAPSLGEYQEIELTEDETQTVVDHYLGGEPQAFLVGYNS